MLQYGTRQSKLSCRISNSKESRQIYWSWQDRQNGDMAKIGAHMSVAGGFYKAVEAAKALHMDVVQIFTKNNNQ
ncbi:MAG: hypothetical protein ACK5TC_01185, partial [bacterium]